jgi:thiol-disulfide isomerase/thioredoxin
MAELDKHVAAQKGKPVAMDVWATWCVPCREKFPKFVALAGKYQGKAAFQSLTIDEADQTAEAKTFLEKSKATFANFHAKEGAEAVEKKFGFEGVPHYVVWDADGKVVFHTGEFTKLEEKLKALIAAKKDDK